MELKLNHLESHIENISKKLDDCLKQPSTYSIFILYGIPLAGKTTISKRIAERLNGDYINLLKDKLEELNPCLGLYGPANFKRDINDYSKKATSIVIIDEIEALLDTWTREQQDNFFKMLSCWRSHSLVLVVTRIELDFEQFLGDDKVFRI